jgi:hypothetical protein
VYGEVRLDLAGQIHGIAATAGPMPFTRTDAFPSHGRPMASDDITGGPGYVGLGELKRFLDGGGLLITLGHASELALEGGLTRGVRRVRPSVLTPGVELRATFEHPDHPLTYGYPHVTSVFRTNQAVYDAPRHWLEMSYCTSCLDGPFDREPIVLRWGAEGQPLVVSGGARGEAELAGRPAILDLPVGKGRVIAYNFNPLHRDLNHSDHRLLWNALLNSAKLVER